MTKQNKRLFGAIGLIVVAIMTIVAYFIPTNQAAAISEQGDRIRVVVYNQYPSISFSGLSSTGAISNPSAEMSFLYENIDYVDFSLTYTDEDGNDVVIVLPRFTPTELDPEFGYASGEETLTIDLTQFGLSYGQYTLAANAHSPIGYDEDSLEFSYVPAAVTDTNKTDENGDPIITIEYEEGTARLEIMAYDDDGNAVFTDPIVIDIDPPYSAGSVTVTLPFSSYGLPTGDYYIEVTAYKYVSGTDEYGNPIDVLQPVDAPKVAFKVYYVAPNAPAVPDTGTMTGSLDITRSDLMITASIAMAAICAFSLFILSGRAHKKDYRKNLRRRR